MMKHFSKDFITSGGFKSVEQPQKAYKKSILSEVSRQHLFWFMFYSVRQDY